MRSYGEATSAVCFLLPPIPAGLAVLGPEMRVAQLLAALCEAARDVPVGKSADIDVVRKVLPAPDDDAKLPLLLGRQ